jgi:hypothetical protein
MVKIISSLPLKVFSTGYMLVQCVNVIEWVTQIGPSLSNGFMCLSLIAMVLKFDAGICGYLLAMAYSERRSNDRNIPAFVKTMAKIFIWIAGAFSIITLIFTIKEMHQHLFGVVWSILLLMVGQNILEIMCFIYMVFFTNRLFKEFNAIPKIQE